MWDMFPLAREIADAAFARLCHILEQLQVRQAREDDAFRAFMTKAVPPREVTQPTPHDTDPTTR